MPTPDTSHMPDAPFVIEHERRDPAPSGSFTPAARLVLTPAARTGGLLARLPGEEAKSLLALLTFLTPNGRVQPGLAQIAEALGVSEAAARERMERLGAISWQGQPLVHKLQRPFGPEAYAPSPALLEEREAPAQQQTMQPDTVPIAGRDRVLAHSREAYGTPRDEAERQVLEQLGPRYTNVEPQTNDDPLVATLCSYGLLRSQAERLVENYPRGRIERQVAWMGHRNAMNPARFLVRAIEEDYEAPYAVRKEAAEQAQEAEQAGAAGRPVPAPQGDEPVSLAVPETAEPDQHDADA